MSQFNARRYRVAVFGTKVLGHLLASTVVFTIFGLLFMTESALHMLDIGLLDHQIAEQLWLEMGLIYGVSMCFWAMLYIGFQLVIEARKSRKRMAMATARGTIVTETLIVLPVFLMLVFGLGQMGVNSMAGLLTTLGTYQAARTLAVWAPEENMNRSGNGQVTPDIIEEKARVAAAGVIAPVTPALTRVAATGCADNNTMNLFLESLTGAGLAPNEAAALALDGGQEFVWSFVDAFDTGSFAGRGWFKMQNAYCSVTVEYTDVIIDPDDNDRQQFDTTVTYVHPAVFPLVGHIFGTGADGANNPWGSTEVAAITRTYQLTQQVTPNPELPKQGAISSLISGIGSLP